jgi:hypothetical protein
MLAADNLPNITLAIVTFKLFTLYAVIDGKARREALQLQHQTATKTMYFNII